MYALNDVKMFYDMADDQVIIIDSSSGDYYALNILASLTFDYLAKGASTLAVCSALQSLSADSSMVEEKLNAFIAQLIEQEILIKTGASTDMDVAFSPDVVADGFDFDMEKFDDSQDILLADPIHDVEEEQGWPVLKK